jgi:hypothetical protein
MYRNDHGRVAVVAVLLTLVAAVAVAQTETPAPEKAAASTARVTFEFGRGLDRETRTLQEPGTTFASDVDEVWCLTRIEGLAAPTTVTHAWYQEGETRARVDLPVGSANWRTWSSKRILPAWTGRWEVKVLDADGTVLGSAAFEIQ